VTDFASLGGARVVSGSVVIPRYGIWSGDVMLASDEDVPAKTTLTIGDLTMACAVYRGAAFAGSRSVRVIGGAAGWGRRVMAKAYGFAAGVRASLILGDAAREVGEVVNLPTDFLVGAFWARANAEAWRVLRQLGGATWYMDARGTTQIQDWPASQIGSDFTVEQQWPDQGRMLIATENYAAWVPRASFSTPFLDGTYVVSVSRFHLPDNGRARVEVLTQ